MEITILPYLDIDFKFELSGYILAPLSSLEEELGDSVFAELWELQEKIMPLLVNYIKLIKRI